MGLLSEELHLFSVSTIMKCLACWARAVVLTLKISKWYPCLLLSLLLLLLSALHAYSRCFDGCEIH